MRVAVDNEDVILSQYRRHVSDNSYLKRWFADANQQGKFVYYSRDLPTKHMHHLVEKLRFHRKDLVFVEVACAAQCKALVVEADSDWNEGVCRYILEEMDISVMKPEACCDRIDR